jgi:hypothetical protein
MSKQSHKPGYNVVVMTSKRKPPVSRRRPAAAAAPVMRSATPGSAEDPRMKEALQLFEAFFAIEDAQGRATLISLAESMVSFDWVRNARLRVLP